MSTTTTTPAAPAEPADDARRGTFLPGLPTWLRPTVYIIEGCDCGHQAGRYHVHAIDPHGLTYWQETHPHLRIVAAYPV